MISQSKFDQLVAEYRQEQQGGSYEQQRADWWARFPFQVTPAWLDALTEEQALEVYRTAGWGIKLFQRTFQENGIERIKASLRYLLYGTDPIEDRFYNVVDGRGSHKLGGMGREFASFLLCMSDNQQYGIWNKPVDNGLKLLAMTPTRQHGEHAGQAYAKVVGRLKEIQKLGSFTDLQYVDEFLELLAKGFIGKEVLKHEPPKHPPKTEESPPTSATQEDIRQHAKIQWLLAKIGRLERHDVWIPAADKGVTYQGETLGSLSLPDLPLFAGPNVLEIAQNIDVIWFKANTATPVKFFEIEHTTSVYSGLLRMNDVRIDYPVPAAAIVAPKERQQYFEKQIGRRTFNFSGLAEVCNFMPYEDVEKLYQVEQIRGQLL